MVLGQVFVKVCFGDDFASATKGAEPVSVVELGLVSVPVATAAVPMIGRDAVLESADVRWEILVYMLPLRALAAVRRSVPKKTHLQDR